MNFLLARKDAQATLVEKRACPRIPSSIAARFFYGNLFYTGTITNFSERGMFIHTRMSLPRDSALVVIMRGQKQILNINAMVRRISQKDGLPRGIGVELVRPSRQYLNYVSECKGSEQ